MPAAPEVRRAPLRGRASSEVDRELEAQQSSGAPRDVCVGREVGVDLDGEGESACRQQAGPEGLADGEDLVGVDRYVVSDHELLDVATQKQRPGGSEDGPCLHRRSAFSIWGRKRRARSMGPATSCGKKATKSAKSRKLRRAVHLAAVDVEGVAQRLEGVEGDADRQEDLEGGRMGFEAERRPRAACQFSAKKLKYLKVPRRPRLATRDWRSGRVVLRSGRSFPSPGRRK